MESAEASDNRFAVTQLELHWAIQYHMYHLMSSVYWLLLPTPSPPDIFTCKLRHQANQEEGNHRTSKQVRGSSKREYTTKIKLVL